MTEFHLNFRINNELEELLLSDEALGMVDKLLLRDQARDISFGRNMDGDWRFLGEITPLAGNSPITTEGIIPFRVRRNFLSPEGNMRGPWNWKSVEQGPGSVIRYTTDGSEPSTASSQYSGPIPLLFSQVIKARLFEPGKLPGRW